MGYKKKGFIPWDEMGWNGFISRGALIYICRQQSIVILKKFNSSILYLLYHKYLQFVEKKGCVPVLLSYLFLWLWRYYLLIHLHLVTLRFINIQTIKEVPSWVNIYIDSFDLLIFEFHVYLDQYARDRTCYNLGSWGNDRASSVDTHNACFILFEHGNCQGRSIEVAPGTNCHYDFRECNFNDITSSFKNC